MSIQQELFPLPGRAPDWMRRRDGGIRRAYDHAEAGEPGWTERAALYLRDYATRVAHGQPFLAEDAREASGARINQPDSNKAWGKAVQVAARRGWIMKAGYAPARSSNGAPKCAWRAS